MAVGSDNLELAFLGSLMKIKILFINNKYKIYRDKICKKVTKKTNKSITINNDIELENTINYKSQEIDIDTYDKNDD